MRDYIHGRCILVAVKCLLYDCTYHYLKPLERMQIEVEHSISMLTELLTIPGITHPKTTNPTVEQKALRVEQLETIKSNRQSMLKEVYAKMQKLSRLVSEGFSRMADDRSSLPLDEIAKLRSSDDKERYRAMISFYGQLMSGRLADSKFLHPEIFLKEWKRWRGLDKLKTYDTFLNEWEKLDVAIQSLPELD
jgi:hypothetical protein